jgi:hypothetical protein
MKIRVRSFNKSISGTLQVEKIQIVLWLIGIVAERKCLELCRLQLGRVMLLSTGQIEESSFIGEGFTAEAKRIQVECRVDGPNPLETFFKIVRLERGLSACQT